MNILFYFVAKIRKNVSQKEVKDFTIEVSLCFYINKLIKGNLSTLFRSSRSQIFFRIDAFKNLAIFTGKQLCLQLYYIETPTQLFSCEYCEIFKNSFFIEIFRWLLLSLSFKIFPVIWKLTSIKIKNVYSFSFIALQVLSFRHTKNVKC